MARTMIGKIQQMSHETMLRKPHHLQLLTRRKPATVAEKKVLTLAHVVFQGLADPREAKGQ